MVCWRQSPSCLDTRNVRGQVYTSQDLENARTELQRLEKAWDNYRGNNPNKFQSDIKAARRKVRHIEKCLTANGTISLTEHEQLERELDQIFPNAESKQIVEHNGRRFQRRFYPLEKSRSGKTVTEWQRSWIDITGDGGPRDCHRD